LASRHGALEFELQYLYFLANASGWSQTKMQLKYRSRAALTHLAFSATVALIVFLTVYLVWFPGDLFEGAGGRQLFLVIMIVDVTLGPLLTFIVFVPGKKGLVFDLVVIVTLQLAALVYGVYVLAESRPVYIVFVMDRFELARANHFSPESLATAPKGLETLPLGSPKVWGSRLPTDPNERFDLSMSGLAGVDVQGYPKYYVPYEEVRAEVLKAAVPIAKLREYNKDKPGAVDKAIAATGRREDELRFVPMRAGKGDLAVLVDAKTGDILHIAAVSPWW
jgi:hypothetical protein